jgi:hypothetical protein
VTTAVRAPSCVLVPYKVAFELRRLLTVWVNNFGAFAAALVVGPCGSIVTSADPHIAAATEEWYEPVRGLVEDIQGGLSRVPFAGSSKPLRRSWQHCRCSGLIMSPVGKMMFACPTCGWILSCDIMIRCASLQLCGVALCLALWHASVLAALTALAPDGRQSDSAKFTAFYAFPLVETVELLVS